MKAFLIDDEIRQNFPIETPNQRFELVLNKDGKWCLEASLLFLIPDAHLSGGVKLQIYQGGEIDFEPIPDPDTPGLAIQIINWIKSLFIRG